MTGTSTAAMAWRNLWRNRRRTVITLVSIAFGVFMAVMLTGMNDRSWTDVINLAARMGGGHVTIQHPEYLDAPSLKRTIADATRVEKVARDTGEIDRAVSRIVGQTMLATAGKSYGALFMAVDPQTEDEDTLAMLEGLDQGSFFESADDDGIIVGSKLAENLGVKLGKKVVYTMTDKQGEIVSGLSRVRGIVHTGSPSMDASLCLLPIGTVRRFLGYEENEATSVVLFIEDHRDSADIADLLNGKLGGNPVALTWKQTQPELAGFIAMKVGGSMVFQFIIAILVAAGIFNTLFMSVMERLREFGILLAIGFSPRRLFSLVMWESLWLALVGLVVAAGVTAYPYWWCNRNGLDFSAMAGGESSTDIAGVGIEMIFYIDIFPENLLIIVVAVVAAVLLSGLYPAWRAGRVEPVETIRLV
jgi:ABC-type lipoprotein release transport system permease subunit